LFLNSFKIQDGEKICEVNCSLFSVEGVPENDEKFKTLGKCANALGNFFETCSHYYKLNNEYFIILLGEHTLNRPFFVDNIYEIRQERTHTLDLTRKYDQEIFESFAYQTARKKLEKEHNFWRRYYNVYFEFGPDETEENYEIYRGITFRFDFFRDELILTINPSTSILSSESLWEKIDRIGIERVNKKFAGHILVECFPDFKRTCRFYSVLRDKKISEKSFKYNGRTTSVIEYYRDIKRRNDVAGVLNPNENVVLVKYDKKQKIPNHHAPSLLKDILSTEELPRHISNRYVYLKPEERWELTKRFLSYLNPLRIGEFKLEFQREPISEKDLKILKFTLPTLLFGRNALLEPTEEDLSKWNWKKKEFLKRYGPYSFPRYLREYVVIYSPTVTEEHAREFYEDIGSVFEVFLKRRLPRIRRMINLRNRRELEEWIGGHGSRLDGVLAIISSMEEYFYLKEKFEEIPLQCFTDGNFKLRWKANKRQLYKNMIFVAGVGFATKMGCRPWILNDELSADCSIGLDVGGEKARLACYCYVFDKKGMFLKMGRGVPQRGEAVDKEKMTKLVLDSVSGAILSDKQEIGRIENLVIHRDGELTGREEKGILQALKRLKKEKLMGENSSCVVVEIKKNHPFRIFGGNSRNAEGCPIGAYAEIDENSVLIATTGEPLLKQGMAQPLLLTIKNLQGSYDKENIARDILCLSELNWGSPLTGLKSPITIKFAEELIPFLEKGIQLEYLPL